MPRKHTASFILELPLKNREHTVLLGRCREVNRGPPSAKPERTNSSGCLRGLDLPGMRCRSSRKDVGINAGSGTTFQRYHQFPDGTRVGRDLYSAFVARFVLDNRLDAIQAAKAWRGAEAFLRAASNGFEPASGKGFALPHATLGVRAGRSKKFHADHREAGDGVALAVLPVSRAPESGEAQRRSLRPCHAHAVEHASPSLQRGEASQTACRIDRVDVVLRLEKVLNSV
jgi:hypothetical protein